MSWGLQPTCCETLLQDKVTEQNRGWASQHNEYLWHRVRVQAKGASPVGSISVPIDQDSWIYTYSVSCTSTLIPIMFIIIVRCRSQGCLRSNLKWWFWPVKEEEKSILLIPSLVLTHCHFQNVTYILSYCSLFWWNQKTRHSQNSLPWDWV